jgi:hypothetical protein
MTSTTQPVAPATGFRAVLQRHLRALAAVGCAAVLAGVLVGGVGGRLAMRLLAASNEHTTGMITDDGFEVGRITAAGTLQLIAASVQFAMIGAVLYLLVRPLLLGPAGARVALATVGIGGTVGAVLVHPESFDFQALDPAILPIVLFVALPMLLVLVFAVLAEHWLAEDSWFMRAPWRQARPALLVWVVGGLALVVVLPLLGVCLVLLTVLHRRPLPERWRPVVLGAGRVVLVAIFAMAVVDLAGDVPQLV